MRAISNKSDVDVVFTWRKLCVCAWWILCFFIHRQPRWIYFNGILRLDVSCAWTVICDTRQSKSAHRTYIKIYQTYTLVGVHCVQPLKISTIIFVDGQSINFYCVYILNCDFFFFAEFIWNLICIFKFAENIFSSNIYRKICLIKKKLIELCSIQKQYFNRRIFPKNFKFCKKMTTVLWTIHIKK